MDGAARVRRACLPGRPYAILGTCHLGAGHAWPAGHNGAAARDLSSNPIDPPAHPVQLHPRDGAADRRAAHRRDLRRSPEQARAAQRVRGGGRHPVEQDAGRACHLHGAQRAAVPGPERSRPARGLSRPSSPVPAGRAPAAGTLVLAAGRDIRHHPAGTERLPAARRPRDRRRDHRLGDRRLPGHQFRRARSSPRAAISSATASTNCSSWRGGRRTCFSGRR